MAEHIKNKWVLVAKGRVARINSCVPAVQDVYQWWRPVVPQCIAWASGWCLHCPVELTLSECKGTSKDYIIMNCSVLTLSLEADSSSEAIDYTTNKVQWALNYLVSSYKPWIAS